MPLFYGDKNARRQPRQCQSLKSIRERTTGSFSSSYEEKTYTISQERQEDRKTKMCQPNS